MEAQVPVRSTGAAAIRLAAAVAALVLGAPTAAWAVPEGEDAGPTPATAKALEGVGELTVISGSLATSTDQDVYAICLDGGGAFSATTTVGTDVEDTQLFLFDGDGHGIYANDDASFATMQSTLPAGHALTPRAEGAYLLAVSGFDDDPADASGLPIFPNYAGVGVYAPDDAAAVHAGWTFAFSQPGAYTITLTGARFCSPPVPAYPFEGPLAPLHPGSNDRKAGAAVPYKFSLGGDRGSDPVVAVASAAVECGSAIEPATGKPAAVGAVTYEDGVYHFNWKTESAWAGTCRQLMVSLDDGTVHRTTFDFS